MKIAIIGAGGVRTPLIVEAMAKRQAQLGLTELSLMDIDPDHLELIGALIDASENRPDFTFSLDKTTDARAALSSADFVITTFRVGGLLSRVIDEKVPLKYGILGQETTGAGGFAMGMRSIPVLLNLVADMQQVCPEAWLINFANPSGMLVEAVTEATSWRRVVGICDAPFMMQKYAASLISVKPEEVYLDYFGLNHLGWVRRVMAGSHDYLPQFIQMMQASGGLPGLPFEPQWVASLGMIPNEYLYFYYHHKEAVKHILASEQTRGEQILAANTQLFSDLQQAYTKKNLSGMMAIFQSYRLERSRSYMGIETGTPDPLEKSIPGLDLSFLDEGYAGVALDLIEGLIGSNPGVITVNGLNQGAISGMAERDVVEIPMWVTKDAIHPLAIGTIPDHCLGLIKLVKEFERLTISAAVDGSYWKALQALVIHPLVGDFGLAKTILDDYLHQHSGYFPELKS